MKIDNNVVIGNGLQSAVGIVEALLWNKELLMQQSDSLPPSDLKILILKSISFFIGYTIAMVGGWALSSQRQKKLAYLEDNNLNYDLFKSIGLQSLPYILGTTLTELYLNTYQIIHDSSTIFNIGTQNILLGAICVGLTVIGNDLK